jgi:hypothetical protein
MTDRLIESLPRRREPDAKPQALLPAAVRSEPRQSAGRADAAAEPRDNATTLAFLAFFDPLPSDYYLG